MASNYHLYLAKLLNWRFATIAKSMWPSVRDKLPDSFRVGAPKIYDPTFPVAEDFRCEAPTCENRETEQVQKARESDREVSNYAYTKKIVTLFSLSLSSRFSPSSLFVDLFSGMKMKSS